MEETLCDVTEDMNGSLILLIKQLWHGAAAFGAFWPEAVNRGAEGLR